MEFGQKIFPKIDLFYFTSFFGQDFLKIFWPTMHFEDDQIPSHDTLIH